MDNIHIFSILCYVVAILNRREAIKLLTIPHKLLRGCDIAEANIIQQYCTTLKLYTPINVTVMFLTNSSL